MERFSIYSKNAPGRIATFFPTFFANDATHIYLRKTPILPFLFLFIFKNQVRIPLGSFFVILTIDTMNLYFSKKTLPFILPHTLMIGDYSDITSSTL